MAWLVLSDPTFPTKAATSTTPATKYVDEAALTAVLLQFPTWADNVNANTKNLSNLGQLNFSGSGFIGTSLGIGVAPTKISSASTPHTTIARILGSLHLGAATQGANDDGLIQLGSYGFVTGNNQGGLVALGRNFATKSIGGVDTRYTPITHASSGYGGIEFSSGQITVFQSAAGATTAGSTISPSPILTITPTALNALVPFVGTSATLSGNVSASGGTFSGVVIGSVKGNRLGVHGGGNWNSALARTDANLLFYDISSSNWAGVGADSAGNIWFRTGLSGSPQARFVIGGDGSLHLNGASSTDRSFYFRSDGVTRWLMFCSSIAESGSNAGSDWRLYRYDDSGVFLGIPLLIERNTGRINIGGDKFNLSGIGTYANDGAAGAGGLAAGDVYWNTSTLGVPVLMKKL
jgi:hypothetical protein